MADAVQGGTEQLIVFIFRGDRLIAGQAAGEEQQGIIGAGVAVHGDHVESVLDHIAECFLQQGRIDGAVCGQVAQHGAHVRMNHAGAFAHAAKTDGNRSFAGSRGKIEFHSILLVDGVRGHDRLAGQGAGFGRIRKILCHCGDTGGNPVQGHIRTDDAGGSHQDFISGDAQDFSSVLRGFAAQAHAFLTGAGIGNAGIDNHRTGGLAGLYNTHIPEYRGSFHFIGGEGAGYSAGDIREEQRHIPTVLILDGRFAACSFKSLCCGETARDLTNLHCLLL